MQLARENRQLLSRFGHFGRKTVMAKTANHFTPDPHDLQADAARAYLALIAPE